MSCFPPKEKPATYSFMLPPPESPGQEKNIPHEPDTVPHYRSRIHAHVLSERKNQLHICSCCFLRNLRDRKNPYRMNPIQSRTTGHEFTVIFSPKGKTSYTLFVLAFFFGMYGRAEKNSTEKKEYTIEKKNRNPIRAIRFAV